MWYLGDGIFSAALLTAGGSLVGGIGGGVLTGGSGVGCMFANNGGPPGYALYGGSPGGSFVGGRTRLLAWADAAVAWADAAVLAGPLPSGGSVSIAFRRRCGKRRV